MADRISKKHRSWNMSRIRGKDTKPELSLRSLLHRRGYRFRLHDPKLPGRPDLVLRKHHSVVFVHGCYWHRHPGCKKATTPKRNRDFWLAKFDANVKRDRCAVDELESLGFRVITIWECQSSEEHVLERKLRPLIEK